MRFLAAPWPEITAALRAAKIRVAVTPYLGTDASDLLPLTGSSHILAVDASKANVKAGLTNPYEIDKFLKLGVRCYTVRHLHAKVYRADERLFVGSPNASRHSQQNLIEASLEVRNPRVIQEFEDWFAGLALVPLTYQTNNALKKVYRAPKLGIAAEPPLVKASSWIMWVRNDDESEETEDYLDSVAAEHELGNDEVFVLTFRDNTRTRRLFNNIRAGDEVFVLDHYPGYEEIAYEPLRVLEEAKLIGTSYRLALEDRDARSVNLEAFVKVAKRMYPGFPSSGKSNRRITSEAAAELRKLWR